MRRSTAGTAKRMTCALYLSAFPSVPQCSMGRVSRCHCHRVPGLRRLLFDVFEVPYASVHYAAATARRSMLQLAYRILGVTST